MIQSQKQDMFKETQRLAQSLQLEKEQNKVLSDKSHQLLLSELNTLLFVLHVYLPYAYSELQERQFDIDALTATLQEKDTIIQSLKDQILHGATGTYIYVCICTCIHTKLF